MNMREIISILESVKEYIPDFLYHATYKPYVESIMKYGLGRKSIPKTWEFSKTGVIYLAKDANVAFSYAETSENVPEEYLDKIVVLKIDTTLTDQSKIFNDENVIDGEDTFEYHAIISPAAISII